MKKKFFIFFLACVLLLVGGLDLLSQTSGNPTNSPVLTIVRGQTPGTLDVSWDTTSGKTYQLQFSTNVSNWFDLGPPVTDDGSKILSTQYPYDTSSFYRVRAY
jgi:hypothetical protein